MAAVLKLPTDALAPLFGVLEKLLIREADERPKDTLDQLWESGAHAADFILAANSLRDLDDRIDECVEERGREIFVGALDKAATRPSATSGSSNSAALKRRLWREAEPTRKRLAEVIGEPASQRWLEGWKGLIKLMDFVEKYTAMQKAEGKSDETDESTPKKSNEQKLRELDGWFDKIMFSAGRGLAIRRAVWELARASVALLPIQRAYEQNRKIDPWLGLALATTVSNGFAGFLDAFVEGLDQLKAKSPEDAATLKDWDRRAGESGTPVFFPLSDASDEW